ncbi:uncharacterized protein [Henckelia pumila]|uniref:uncharacterized protein n=1 Tax=Henckelia pumila TaxID=405737 RepID=UPI003C6E0AFA
MCMDFRDLNKACPKDCYPLPRIDQLVDSTFGYKMFCFMDAYQGYHQNPLAQDDQDKVSFFTSGGATYQRMMNKVFREQMGRNVEVYVDEIMVKSRTQDCFISDLEETFATVRQYGIKLNPTKYIFGEMPSPTSIKERFGWTEKCEQDFQELKEHLASLPILVKPEPGERLWGSEARYTKIEKMSLALVITARKLRPYFLTHPITVLTNSLLGRVLTHPDASGRLVKWTVELGEYDIEYQPRKAIKAQDLSDFLTEVVTFGQEEVWRVFVDGVSSSGGSGMGVILVSPTQEKIKIAVKLDFRASNNEAEYEAVVAGMKQAREVGASHIIIYSDSQLVVQQVKKPSVPEKKN